MILESTLLDVSPGREDEFELAFSVAKTIISRQKGFMDLSLNRSLEKKSSYLLLVHWQTLEDSTMGFRGSTDYQDWNDLLQHYCDPFPTVIHYEMKVKRQNGLMSSSAVRGY